MTITLMSFINNSIIPVAMFDRDMIYLAASQSWVETYENNDDIIGKLHYDMFPDLPEKWKVAHRDGLNGKSSHSDQEYFKFINGKSGWIRWQVSPWYNYGGNIGGIIILSDVITEKKEKELELSNVLKRFELIQQAAKIGMWDWNISDQQIILNAEYYEILGRGNKETISYDDFLDQIHPEDVNRVTEAMNSALDGGQKYSSEFRIYRKNDKKLRWVKDQGNVEFDKNGKPYRAYGAIIDVTENKNLSDEYLKSAGEEYQKFMSSMMEGVWALDRNAITTYVNKSMAEMLGYSIEEMGGNSLYSYMDEKWRKIAINKFYERSDGRSERHEFMFRHKDGSEVWCLVGANPIIEDNEFIGAVAVLTNFTDRKRIEDEKSQKIAELKNKGLA